MKKNTILLFGVLAIAFFAACKTKTQPHTEIDPFGAIGRGADVYIYLPVELHRPIVENALPFASDSSMKTALNRTEILYSGLFLQEKRADVRIFAAGRYPKALTDAVFTKKRGWTKKTLKTSTAYKYYESPFMDICIPTSSAALISLGTEKRQKMDTFLTKIETPDLPDFSKRFLTYTGGSKDIAISIKDSNFFLSQILGTTLGLPIGAMEIYLKKNAAYQTKKSYTYTLIIEAENANAAYVTKILLQKLFGDAAKIENNAVIIENNNISEETIISIMQTLYPN